MRCASRLLQDDELRRKPKTTSTTRSLGSEFGPVNHGVMPTLNAGKASSKSKARSFEAIISVETKAYCVCLSFCRRHGFASQLGAGSPAFYQG
jgi:hypothetical protein